MRFQHPSVRKGTVSQGPNVWPVVDGILDVPEAFGLAEGWRPIPTPAVPVEARPAAATPAPTPRDRKKE